MILPLLKCLLQFNYTVNAFLLEKERLQAAL